MNVTSDFKPVLTKAALALKKQNKASEFQALVFVEKQQQQQQVATQTAAMADNNSKIATKTNTTNDLEFDIKKARQEVLNFAIANQRLPKNAKKMQQFQQAQQGIKIKRTYKNYKVLLDERKRLKQIREQRKQFHQLGKNQTGAASVKCRSKTKLEKQSKKRAPVANIAQHYGVAKPKFKNKK